MSSSNIEERRKIVIPSRLLSDGKVRPSKEVDESDYRIAEEIYNLFSERDRSGYDSYDDFVYHDFGSSGRLHWLWIREIGQAVPETILSLNELKQLSIDCSEMVANPDWFPLKIGHLTSLEELGIRYLHVLPDEIWDLPNLKELYVEGKSVIKIPRSFGFGNLDNLQTMHVEFPDKSEAGRVKFPKSIGLLKNLKTINMENVNASSLQFDYFTSLEHLEMIGTFQTLPSSIGKMKNLKFLHLDYLSKNLSFTLPDEIGDLTNLAELKIENLDMKALPRSIANLKNLRILFLVGAKISTLPDEIGKLMALECLDLRETPLRTLPSSVTDLKMLRHLHLNTEMLNEDSDVDVQGLISALPRVGCIAYGATYGAEDESPQETPASIVQALMHNRGRTRFACSFKKDGEISIPLALWPFVLNRAKHLFRPYSRMKGADDCVDDFECYCCRGKTQSDAIFQLLKSHGSTFVAKEHDQGD